MINKMKTYNDTVNKLSKKTNFSCRKCAGILHECRNDYDKALAILEEQQLDPSEIFFDSVSGLFFNETGKTMIINDSKGNEIISLSWIIPVLFLLLADVPSWVIALLMIVMLLFNLDFRFETKNKKDIIKETTIDLAAYKETKLTVGDLIVDKDGYYEITVK